MASPFGRLDNPHSFTSSISKAHPSFNHAKTRQWVGKIWTARRVTMPAWRYLTNPWWQPITTATTRGSWYRTNSSAWPFSREILLHQTIQFAQKEWTCTYTTEWNHQALPVYGIYHRDLINITGPKPWTCCHAIITWLCLKGYIPHG